MAERAHPEIEGFRDPDNPYRRAFQWRHEWVAPHCRGKDVLDVPCGMGWGTSLLEGCRSLMGMDRAVDAIAEARDRYGGSGIDFVVGDMGRLGLPVDSLDVVVCLEGIEHVPEDTARQFLTECRRVLRPSASLFVSSPHCLTRPHSGNPYHLKEYQPEELMDLLRPAFEVAERQSRRVDDLEVTYVHAIRRA